MTIAIIAISEGNCNGAGKYKIFLIENDKKYDWDLAELQTDHHPIRTEYETAAVKMGNKKRLNPETGEIEAFISNTRIYPSLVFHLPKI